MTSIVGQYECKADAKGRITLPASLKNKLMPFMGNDFVIKRSLDTDCLELYPQEKFDEMMKMVMSHPNKGKDFRIWLRKFTAGLKDDVAIDKESGRMQIPKNLFDHIGLGKEVVLNAAHTMIEIWDKSKYEEMLGSMSDERYDEISEEIFNGGGQILP
ncbi:division/cell wall cluster transcriptional repressor MraZ [Croceivirga lutea]|uniref:division/cell wall cluster transcriptional repressor MraZ n=1 Tax=Croceivirga lutea TaxID=1775167 RepID=UPI00163AE5D9|nr:division/cell wall cluster transcriptional repressor MraZ [Croceivirga lutea]